VQPKTIVDQLALQVAEFTKQLPVGYSVALGGAVEESAKSQKPIEAVVPLMLFVMATILMIQLAKFPAAVPCLYGRAPGVDRRGLGFAPQRGTARIRGNPGCAGADRHPGPQLSDIDRADPRTAGSRSDTMGGGRRGDRASHAADPAYRGRGKFGAHSHCARDFLGADGVRNDGRHHCWDAADAPVSTSFVCGVVSR
jgi:hypothetical protein